MYEQLVTPELNVPTQLARCLKYVQDAFKSPNAGRTATVSWNTRTLHRHFDRKFPTGVYFLAWFDYWATIDGSYENFGHVVICRDGICYSSPYKAGQTSYAVIGSISEVERIYRCTFVGWSEDIAGLKVIQEGVVMPSEMNVRDYFKSYIHREPTQDEIKFYTIRPWTELATNVCDTQLGKIKELEAGSDEYVETKVYIKR